MVLSVLPDLEPGSPLDAALAAAAAGLSVIPIPPDGSKSPKIKWKQYQAELATEAQIRAWFAVTPSPGLAVIGGTVSGHLEMMEFEGRAVDAGLHHEFRHCAEQAGLGDVLSRVLKGWTQQSPSGGLHLIYRCPEGVEGNQKLARRDATGDELAAQGDDAIKVLIETRGEGGYFISAPSNGTVHATGNPWTLLNGGFDTIANVTAEERDALLDLARTFDQMPRQPASSPKTGGAIGDELRPGDDYNNRANWANILVPHGWTHIFTAADGNQHWRRPGKDIGTSATISEHGEGVFYVFTSSTIFEERKGYSRFHAYTIPNHGGDFSAAARELAAAGYGGAKTPPVRQTSAPAARVDSGVTSPGPPVTDLANAERFVHRHGVDVSYVYEWRQFLAWDGARWAQNALALVERHAQDTAKSIWDEVGAPAGAEGGYSDAQKRLIAWAIQSASDHRLTSMTKVARAHVAVTPDKLDADGWLLNTPSGTIDLRSGELRLAAREDLITKLTAAPYDPDAECPLWLKFLGEVLPDPELVAYVQKLIGYSLTGEVLEHSLHILFGTGRNGKGVFTNTVVKMLGDYGDVTDPETFLARKDAAHPSNTAVLHGKRLVASSETDSGRRLNEATVKNLTGGDIVKTRRMHQDWWSYIPTATMLLATNHLPAVRGTDVGIWSRLHVVPFTVSFLGREDLHLEEKLRAEQAGILNWMVQGCLAWQRDGLVVPDAVKVATNAYRADMDSVGRWLAERCELDPRAPRIEMQYLALDYEAWCTREGETAVERPVLGKALTSHNVGSVKSGATRYRTGIRLI